MIRVCLSVGTQTDCGYVNPKSAVHVISGAAGCNEREYICADVFLEKVHHWSAYRWAQLSILSYVTSPIRTLV